MAMRRQLRLCHCREFTSNPHKHKRRGGGVARLLMTPAEAQKTCLETNFLRAKVLNFQLLPVHCKRPAISAIFQPHRFPQTPLTIPLRRNRSCPRSQSAKSRSMRAHAILRRSDPVRAKVIASPFKLHLDMFNRIDHRGWPVGKCQRTLRTNACLRPHSLGETPTNRNSIPIVTLRRAMNGHLPASIAWACDSS